MAHSSISGMLKIQTRLRTARDRYFVMSAGFAIVALGLVYKLVNALFKQNILIGQQQGSILLIIACAVGAYFSYKAALRCSAQMKGETRRWQKRVQDS